VWRTGPAVGKRLPSGRCPTADPGPGFTRAA